MKWKIPLFLAILALIGLAGLYAYVLSYDFNRLKPEIIAAVQKNTGRELVIKGDIRVAVGLLPSLVIEGVALQNAAWGSRPQMLHIKRFELQLALLPILTGALEVRKASLIDAELFLEVSPSGLLNLPEVGTQPQASKPEDPDEPFFLPQIALKNVRIINCRLLFKGRLSKKPLILNFKRLGLKAPARGDRARFEFTATYNQQPLASKGSVGSINALLDAQKPWPLELTVNSVGSKLSLNGTMKDVLKAGGIALDFKFTSRDVSKTAAAAGFKVPFKRTARAEGHLSGSLTEAIRFSRLKMRSGKNRLQGFVLARFKGGKPYFNATLTSERLDLRPAKRPGAAASGGKPALPDRKLFSARPFPRDFLSKFDADVGLRAKQCLFPRSALQDLKLNLTLKNSRLTLKPVRASVGGGNLQAHATLYARKRQWVLRAGLAIAHLDAGRMLADLGISDALEGEFDLNARIAGRGISVAELMAGADGHFWVIMSNGRFNNRLLALAGGDLRAGLFDLIAPGDQTDELTEINCLVTRFDITDGVARTRVLILDTPALRAIGKGDINLKSEKLNIALNPIPKKGVGADGVGKLHLSLGNLTKPFKLGGTLANPSLAIDAKRAALTIGKAFGGFALFGPFGLAALLIDGDASEKDLCKTAVTLARRKQTLPKKSSPQDRQKQEKKTDGPGTFLNNLKKMFK